MTAAQLSDRVFDVLSQRTVFIYESISQCLLAVHKEHRIVSECSRPSTDYFNPFVVGDLDKSRKNTREQMTHLSFYNHNVLFSETGFVSNQMSTG